MGIDAMIATGTLGTGLALVYILGERSLAPVIVAHFVVTATIQPGIMFWRSADRCGSRCRRDRMPQNEKGMHLPSRGLTNVEMSRRASWCIRRAAPLFLALKHSSGSRAWLDCCFCERRRPTAVP